MAMLLMVFSPIFQFIVVCTHVVVFSIVRPLERFSSCVDTVSVLFEYTDHEVIIINIMLAKYQS